MWHFSPRPITSSLSRSNVLPFSLSPSITTTFRGTFLFSAPVLGARCLPRLLHARRPGRLDLDVDRPHGARHEDVENGEEHVLEKIENDRRHPQPPLS